MPLTGKFLEDSIRLDRIRSIKRMLYGVQAAMLVALGIFAIVYLGDAQLKPFYFPLDSFAAIMILLLLVICVEGFFFRILEIRFARSSSARHLMAKNSIKQALLVAVASGIPAMMLLVPPIMAAVHDTTQTTKVILPGDDQEFWSRDPLAIQRTVKLRVTAVAVVDVYLVDDRSYQLYKDNLSALYLFRINDDSYRVDGDLVIEVPKRAHALYHLTVNDMYNPGTGATVVFVKELSETFQGIVALLLLAFAVANVAWIAYLIPIERKYSEGSIYK